MTSSLRMTACTRTCTRRGSTTCGPAPATDMRSRRQTSLTLLAIVLGMFLLGMVVPFALGDKTERVLATRSAAGGAAPFGTSPGPAVATENANGAGPAAPALVSGATGAATPGRARSAGPAAGGTASAAERVAASHEVGVTATALKVGVFLPDLGNASKVGVNVPGFSAQDQQVAWDAYLGNVNDAGGVNGRRVEPVYRTVDI